MNYRVKISLIMLLLLGFVTLSGYLLYKNIFLPKLHITQNKKKPNVFIYDLYSTNFNKEGEISSKVFTPSMQYDSFNKFSTMINPRIKVFQKNDPSPWFISADKGAIFNGNGKYQLIGNVKLTQKLTQKTLATIITTSELTFYPSKKLAETRKPITFIRVNKDKSSMVIHSVGAKVNQKTGDVQLLSKAQGVYDAK